MEELMLEKTLESPLDCKEIQPVHSKGDQSWVFIGGTNVKAETPQLVFVPNLLFPGQRSVAAGSASEVVVCLPPPLAWGTSPPWRYNERPDEVLAKLSEAFARFLFEDGLPAAHAALQPRAEVFALASAVLFLRQAEGEAAGDQFMVMEKKTRGLKSLPAVVAALETVLADRRAGKYGGFADYLPQLAGVL